MVNRLMLYTFLHYSNTFTKEIDSNTIISLKTIYEMDNKRTC